MRASNIKTYEAFNETKTLKEWSQDTRCEIGYSTLKKRIKDGLPLFFALNRRQRKPRCNDETRKRKYTKEQCDEVKRLYATGDYTYLDLACDILKCSETIIGKIIHDKYLSE